MITFADTRAAIVQSNGKILVGGLFSSVGGATRNHIARLNPLTGIADSFNPNASNSVTSIVVQADGNVVIYSDRGEGVWSSGTGGNGGAYLAAQDDGDLVIHSNNTDRILWSTRTPGR